MKAGTVVRIRVNPRDCQSVLDLVDKLGLPRHAVNFSQLVSIALASTLESARLNGHLPEPDPFQYLDRMSEYIGKGKGNIGTRLAKDLQDLGGDFRAPVVVDPLTEVRQREGYPPDTEAGSAVARQPAREPTKAEIQRLTELLKKEDIDELTDAEQGEKDGLVALIYPDG